MPLFAPAAATFSGLPPRGIDLHVDRRAADCGEKRQAAGAVGSPNFLHWLRRYLISSVAFG